MDRSLVFIVVTMLFFTSRLDNIHAANSSMTHEDFPTFNSTVHSPTERQTVSLSRTITSMSSLKLAGAAATTKLSSKVMKTTRGEATTEAITTRTTTQTTTGSITRETTTTHRAETASKTTLTITQSTRFPSTTTTYSQTSLKISSAITSYLNIPHASSSVPPFIVSTSIENRSLGFTSLATAAFELSATSFSSFGTSFTLKINKSTKTLTPSLLYKNATSAVSRSLNSFFHILTQHSSTIGNYQRSSAHSSSSSPLLSEGEMRSTVLSSAIVTATTNSTKQMNKNTKTSSSLHPTSIVSSPLSSLFDTSTLYRSTSSPSSSLSKGEMYSTALPSATGTPTTSSTGNVTVILVHPENKKTKPGIIAAAVLVPLVVIALGIVGCVKYWRYRKQTEQYRHSLLHQMDNL